MATLVLFYSATGNTRKAATALAGALGAELCEITCSAYAKGLWGPFRKAYDVLAGRNPPVEIPEKADQVWDMIVLGTPVWGARPAPPIRSYLQRDGRHYARLAMFVTASGTSPKYPPGRAIEEMMTMSRLPPQHTCIFTEAQINGPDFTAAITACADKMQPGL